MEPLKLWLADEQVDNSAVFRKGVWDDTTRSH
jgi:hypothetical protein